MDFRNATYRVISSFSFIADPQIEVGHLPKSRHVRFGVNASGETGSAGLEERVLPPVETEASRRSHELVLDLRRRRAERQGEPMSDDVPQLAGTRQMFSVAAAIMAGRPNSS